MSDDLLPRILSELLDIKRRLVGQDTPSKEELLTVKQVAARLHCEPATVRCHIEAGRLRASKAGKRWLVRAGDLESFLSTEEPDSAAPDDQLVRLLSKVQAR